MNIARHDQPAPDSGQTLGRIDGVSRRELLKHMNARRPQYFAVALLSACTDDTTQVDDGIGSSPSTSA
jgi:hypothetical protein